MTRSLEEIQWAADRVEDAFRHLGFQPDENPAHTTTLVQVRSELDRTHRALLSLLTPETHD